VHALIRTSLWGVGLHRCAQANVFVIELGETEVPVRRLSEAFDGYTLLQLSDLHLDISAGFTEALHQRCPTMKGEFR
jgi:uncharacterized protein